MANVSLETFLCNDAVANPKDWVPWHTIAPSPLRRRGKRAIEEAQKDRNGWLRKKSLLSGQPESHIVKQHTCAKMTDSMYNNEVRIYGIYSNDNYQYQLVLQFKVILSCFSFFLSYFGFASFFFLPFFSLFFCQFYFILFFLDSDFFFSFELSIIRVSLHYTPPPPLSGLGTSKISLACADLSWRSCGYMHLPGKYQSAVRVPWFYGRNAFESA